MDEKQILTLLASDDSEKIREGAFEAGYAGLESAVPLLVRQLEQVHSTGALEAIDGALRRIGGKAVVHAVIPLLRSEDPPVRNIAMDVLRELGHSEMEPLLDLMHDDDPDVRIFGAHILGGTGSALAVPVLANALLKDPEVNVRYQAAVSLGDLAYSEAADALNHSLNEDDEWVKFAVIEALAKVRDESSIGAMLQALKKSSNLVAGNIVEAIGEMGYIKAAPMLIDLLPHSEGPLANRIVRAIVQLVGAKSLHFLGKEQRELLTEYMLKALEDEGEQVQDAAIAGLGYVKGEREFGAVFRVLAGMDPERERERMLESVKIVAGMGYHNVLEEIMRSGSEQERFLAVDIMSMMDDRHVVTMLASVFWEQERDLRRQIIEVLGATAGAEEQDFFLRVLDEGRDGSILKSAFYYFARNNLRKLIYDKIFPFLEHPYNDVKKAALDACMSLNGPHMRARFIEMTSDIDASRRKMAYQALRVYDAPDVMPYLAAGLKDQDAEVRRTVVESIGTMSSLTNRERLLLLAPCLEDLDKSVRLGVIDVFGLFEDDEVAKYLARGFHDADPWIRARSVESLGRKRDETRAPEIACLLQDEEPLVVLKAMEALMLLGGDVAFRYLLPLVDHSVPEVQAAAQDAVAMICQELGV